MHRIRSWARAHASIGSPSQSSSTNPVPGPHNADLSAGQDAQIGRAAGDPLSAGSSQEHDQEKPKPSVWSRLRDGTIRFGKHTKTTLFHSWVNVLLVFVPAGIAVEAAGLSPAVIFALNAVAIVPLAGLLSHATECVASRLGDTVGALINVTFGNAVELIIFIIALVKNEIRIVQASLLGSILANLLLILGMAFLLGGLRFQEQIYNSTVTQMSACLLSLSVTSLLLPTVFHASWSNSDVADRFTLKVSRGTSVVLLLVYFLYIIFQLKSHAYLYASIPQRIIDEESHPGILAELMNSSSDSSSSSSDDSDDTTASWTTAKRIKKAVKYRRHRKSSTSSKGTTSRQSFRKKALSDMPPVVAGEEPDSVGGSIISHPDEHASSAIDFGDEARYDADDDARRVNAPRFKDFGQMSHDGKPTKEERKNRKRERKLRKMQEKAAKNVTFPSAPETLPRRPSLKPYMSESCIPRGDRTPEEGPADMTKKKPAFPTIPSLLSNTVFSAQPPEVSTPCPPPNVGGLRRTNSMPVRMNRLPVVGNAVQYARGADAAGSKVTETSDESKEPDMSRTAAIVLLLISTALVAVCAEFLVDAIPEMIQSSSVSEAFIGLIILPIVGNAAEHVTAVTVATKNKMDLSIGVSVGSSIQIAIFVTPLVVIIGWCMDKDMTLYFTLFETICLVVTAFVVNFLVLDGRSNYLEGALLIAAYVIIALAAFYYPDSAESSNVAGSGY